MSIHRPFIGIFFSFGLGILAEVYLKIPWVCLLPVALVILACVLFFWKKKAVVILIFLSFVGLGVVFLKSYQYLPQDHVDNVAKYYRRNPTLVEGVIVSDVETRLFRKTKKTVFKLDVKKVKAPWGWQEKRGRVLVNVFRSVDLDYGDRVVLEGKFYQPFDFSGSSTSYRDYLSRRGIRHVLSVKKQGFVEILGSSQGNPVVACSLRVRDRFRKILSRQLSPSEAGMMQAFLLGDRSSIRPNINELFIQTGTAHILAISGFNIGIVACLILLFFKTIPIGMRAQYILTIVLLVFYALLTGGQPSVVRATIMATIFLSSFLVERELDVLNSLAGAALIILLCNPLNLFDVGFQLSFVSVWAIILFYGLFLNLLFKRIPILQRKPWRYFAQSLAVSLSAWLGVAGLIAYYFNIITPITILANLFIIPISSLLIALGLGLLWMGFFLPSWGFVFALCIKVLINLMIACVFVFSQIPFAYFCLESVSLTQVIIYYMSISILGFLLRLKRF